MIACIFQSTFSQYLSSVSTLWARLVSWYAPSVSKSWMPQWLVHPQIIAQRKSQPQIAIFCWFCWPCESIRHRIAFKQQGTPPSLGSAMMVSNNNISKGWICSHTPAMLSSKTISAYEILQYLFVDNGVFLFGTWSSMQEGRWNWYLQDLESKCTRVARRRCPKPNMFSPPPEILSEYAKKKWHKMMILSLEGVWCGGNHFIII